MCPFLVSRIATHRQATPAAGGNASPLAAVFA